MGGLFGGGGSNAQTPVKLASVQVSTSMYGKPKALAYGCTLLASNMIDYAGFTSQATSSGGKGGGGGVTGYNYWSDLILALCEGGSTGIVGVQRVWRDKDCYTLSYYGLSLMTGARPQAPWGPWASKWPSRALGYSGTAYVGVLQAALGSDGTPPNWNFEVQALLGTEQDPNWPGAYDAKPSAVIVDALSNPYYGAGFAASRIANLVTGAASFQTYCTACGFAISPAWTDQSDAATCIQQILDATNSELVWTCQQLSGGGTGMVLNVVPYGDTPITANGVTYTPNTTPLYDLTYDDFLGAVGKDGQPTGTDPISVTRSSTQDIKNDVPVEFWDRTNSYNVSIVDTPEPSDVSLNGLKQDSPLTLHLITRAAHAKQISAIKAQRNVFARNTYTFKVGWRYSLLEPMDLVTLTDAITGLYRKIVRIVSVDFPDETSEEDGLTVTAEEWPFGIGTSALYTTQSNAGNPTWPGPATASLAPSIFEPSVRITRSGEPEIWIATSGAMDTWGGCEVWVSTDGGSSYGAAPVGVVKKPSRYGTTTASLAAGTPLDTTDMLAVSMAATGGGVLTGTDANGRDALVTACLVGDEILAYQTATLTGPGAYNLTTLRRGGFGTTNGSHASGSTFVFLDDAPFAYQFDQSLIGKTITVKLVAFNALGLGKQDISTVAAYSYTVTGNGGDGLRVDTDSSLTAIEAISDDGILSRAEKPATITNYNAAVSDYTLLFNKARATGTSYAAFASAFTALQTYILGLSPAYNDTTQDTTIDPSTWQTIWANWYQANTNLVLTLAGAPPSTVTAISTSNLNLTTNASAPVIDGATMVPGNTVLAAGQTAKADNAIYAVAYAPPAGSSSYFYPTAGSASGTNYSYSADGSAYDGTSSTPNDGTYATLSSHATLTTGNATVIYSGWSGTLTGTLTVKTTPILPLDDAGGSSSVTVYYSTDGGSTWALLASYGNAQDGVMQTATVSLSGVAGANLRIKVYTSSVHYSYWDGDTYLWTTKTGDAQINTVAFYVPSSGSPNYSYTKIATLYDGTLWRVSSGSTYGGKIYLVSVASDNTVALTQQAYDTGSYDLNCSVTGKPGAGAKILIYPAPRAFTIQAQGHLGSAGTANTTNPKDFIVAKNGTTIGTLRFGASGAFSVLSFTATSFAVGDVLTITAPASQDATLADLGFTLRGNI